MNKKFRVYILVMLLAYIAGFSNPKGLSVAERQDYVRQMRDRTLQELYSERKNQKSGGLWNFQQC